MRIQLVIIFILVYFNVSNAQKKTNPKNQQGPIITTANGKIEGTYEGSFGLRSFKGIPFAAPPLRNFRFKEPQAVENWQGIRMTNHFGPKAMQSALFSDMRFRSNGTSEDCLYLNIWTPATKANEKLPVLVYFYGGGFVGGDGSEYRYDGASMARKGIVTITVNYRLGIFGFFSHPELSRESLHHASGNYGLLDQNAALKWVKKNISAFGGDPQKITIAGESAGSISVFAQMASPLSKDLIAGAIGESGAMIKPTLPAVPLEEAENDGLTFMKKSGIKSISELRSMDAEKVLELATQSQVHMPPVIDGYFLPEIPSKIFKEGKQAKVPLLLGWNSGEKDYKSVISDSLSFSNYNSALKKIFGKLTDDALKVYPGNSKEEIIASAADLAADRFIVYSTWKWADLHLKSSNQQVYRYYFSRVRQTKEERKKPLPPGSGASHSSEIEYALGNLETNLVYDWNKDDFRVSDMMEEYFANFIKSGNPNAVKTGLNPQANFTLWQPLTIDNPAYLNIDVKTEMKPMTKQPRYLFLDKVYQ